MDEMWHTFVLFTKEYAAYCEEKFGRFVHHVPTTKAEKDERERERESNPEGFRAQVEAAPKTRIFNCSRET